MGRYLLVTAGGLGLSLKRAFGMEQLCSVGISVIIVFSAHHLVPESVFVFLVSFSVDNLP